MKHVDARFRCCSHCILLCVCDAVALLVEVERARRECPAPLLYAFTAVALRSSSSHFFASARVPKGWW
jgi:hypothetical protein